MIAAGEVVERPSAVLKELMENALDAGARRINVDLVAGGRRLVQVSDDGAGMNGDDAVLCFERHATSKISASADLNAINTYGFRGEALPSIASVSRVQLQTCADDSGAGTEVIIEGGQLRTVREVGRTRGTTAIVRDLFFNTPARRKFLRTDSTELRHIIREITALGLARPELAFSLTHGGRVLLECNPAGTWQERIQSLFGREMLVRGVFVDKQNEVGALRGLLGRPGDAGGGFTEQFLLVNGRSVQSRVFRKAVLDGFEATTEGGKQPFFVLFLELDPATVDVNVHPQKREVRFRDDKAVYDFVFATVRSAFAQTAQREQSVQPVNLPIEPSRPEDEGTNSSTTPPNDAAAGPPQSQSAIPHFWTTRPFEQPYRPAQGAGGPGSNRFSDGEPAYVSAESGLGIDRGLPEIRRAPREVPDELKFDQLAMNLVSKEKNAFGSAGDIDVAQVRDAEKTVWQFQRKYIFVSTRDGLWIIDQHVAHERILFEEAMAAFAGDFPASQQLLFPLLLELTPEQDAVFDDTNEMFKSMGFGLRRLTGHKIEVDALPGALYTWLDGEVLRQMIDEINEYGFKRTGLREQIAVSYSCHAAIKSGDALEPAKMRWLIERLFATSMPYVCPHGRPVIVKIETSELDQRFGRS
jgi:DNA mismatch repair protein MutL